MAKKQRRTVRKPAAKRPARKPTRPSPRKSKAKAPKGGGVSGKARAMSLFAFTHKMMMDLVADWPADKRTFQSSPTDNHMLWTVGHLVTAYAWFGSALGISVPKPEGYDAMFGWGSKPTGDAAAYPSYESVKAACDAAHAAIVKGIEAQSDEELLGAAAIDTGGFASDRLNMIEKLAWHEGWHAGQVSTLRRALGLKGVMG